MKMNLKDLTQKFGVSGSEGDARDYIVSYIKDYADEIKVDVLGNLIALKKGMGKNKKKIMVSAHMDEIGFMITHITDKGYLKVRNIGGISVPVSVMNKVKFKSGVIGVICSQDPLNKLDTSSVSKLYIDIGVSSKEEALKYVSIGEKACYLGDFYEIGETRVVSKAIDDRVGCFISMKCIERMKEVYNDVYFVFSVQEELGLRGAKTAAEGIKPDVGIALDITGSYDVPENSDGNMRLGEGAAIKAMDNSVVCDEYIVSEMINTAKEFDIKYQIDVLPGGGTDAGAICTSNEGVRSGGISIASRNGHSPVCMVDKNDIEDCIKLLVKFIDRELKF